MSDRMPTPEEFAAAAKELADARAELDTLKANETDARREATGAANRVERAATALRQMTDRLAPPPQKGHLVAE